MTSWSVYLLRCSDDSLYCGISRDVKSRVAQHNGLKPGGARYTKGRRPVILLASLDNLSHSEALRVEAAIKKMPKQTKIQAFCSRDRLNAIT